MPENIIYAILVGVAFLLIISLVRQLSLLISKSNDLQSQLGDTSFSADILGARLSLATGESLMRKLSGHRSSSHFEFATSEPNLDVLVESGERRATRIYIWPVADKLYNRGNPYIIFTIWCREHRAIEITADIFLRLPNLPALELTLPTSPPNVVQQLEEARWIADRFMTVYGMICQPVDPISAS